MTLVRQAFPNSRTSVKQLKNDAFTWYSDLKTSAVRVIKASVLRMDIPLLDTYCIAAQ